MKAIQVGLLGIGTVGKGTFEVLQRNQGEIQSRAGRGIEISMVADLDTARAQTVVGSAAKVVTDAREVIANPDIDIVIELIGGYGIARQLVMAAIEISPLMWRVSRSTSWVLPAPTGPPMPMRGERVGDMREDILTTDYADRTDKARANIGA